MTSKPADRIEEELFEYIQKNTPGSQTPIKQQTLLFKEGIFDSMGFVLLVDFIEEKFEIKTSDYDMVEANFESVSAIAGFIRSKLTAGN